jgi:protein-tyrosine phosphatase
VRILFVCLGNICRSPTAEGMMRHVLREEGLSDRVEVESAGTAAYHAGEAPDARAAAAARERGVELAGAARQVTHEDFERFDLIVAMDAENLADLDALVPDDEVRGRIRLLREFDPDSDGTGDLDVPDPYYGGPQGFDDVLDLVEAACRGLLDELREAGAV